MNYELQEPDGKAEIFHLSFVCIIPLPLLDALLLLLVRFWRINRNSREERTGARRREEQRTARGGK